MSTRQYRSTVEAKNILMPGGMSATSGADTMTLNSTTTVPSSFPFTMVIDPDTATEEIVTVISLLSGSTYNVYRGQDGTSPQAHANGAVVKHMVTARDLQETQNHIEASSAYTINNPGDDTGVTTSTITKSVHGIGSNEGAVVGTLKTQTLTNKTINTPTINTPKINENVALTATSTELNILDGATLTTTELNYVDGVTSAIQTQINAVNTNISNNTPVGTIVMYGAASAPSGWLLCNGAAIPSQHTALIALVGANTPDLCGRTPIGYGAGTGLTARNTIGEKFGVESVTLTSAQSGLPGHSHDNTVSISGDGAHAHDIKTRRTDGSHDHNNSSNNVGPAAPPGNGAYSGVTQVDAALSTGHSHSVSISNATNSAANAAEAHTNVQPSTVVNFIIKY